MSLISPVLAALALALCAPARAELSIGLWRSSSPPAGLLAGAKAAAAEAGAALKPLEASRPWREGAGLMARALIDDRLAAVVGPSDGAGAHLAAQAATRVRVPVVLLSPEDSLTAAKDPWVFRAVPGDEAQARALLRWAFEKPAGRTAALVVPEGREGRERRASLERACRTLGVSTASRADEADALLVWLDPIEAAGFLSGLRTPAPRLLASLRLDDPDFLSRAPPQAEGLALPLLHAAGKGAGWAEAAAYDAVERIARAAREGPSPAEIRRALAAASLKPGRSGAFRFDSSGNRAGEIPVAVLRRGTYVPAK